MKNNFSAELLSFQTLWNGGYYEGDPLAPLSRSIYGDSLNFMSVIHATYLCCIKPYVNENVSVLEIGPGRGAWTKCFLNSKAKEIVVLDALSADHNGFWEYIGNNRNVEYFKVNDFSCKELKDEQFDYMFSFGCLCHVSFEGITEYAKNIYSKLKPGSHCFWMIADYDKYNHTVENIDKTDVLKLLFKERKGLRYFKFIEKMLYRKKYSCLDKNENTNPSPGRWYHAGVGRTCQMLESFGYKIIDKDVETIHRDPIIHFLKR